MIGNLFVIEKKCDVIQVQGQIVNHMLLTFDEFLPQMASTMDHREIVDQFYPLSRHSSSST